jgi:hypothetical protein
VKLAFSFIANALTVILLCRNLYKGNENHVTLTSGVLLDMFSKTIYLAHSSLNSIIFCARIILWQGF